MRAPRHPQSRARRRGRNLVQDASLHTARRPLLYFAGWRRHYSLYPATDRVVAAFEDDLAAYTVDKATIRFPLSQPVPIKLIERIARLRAKEVGERAKEKAGAAKEQTRARPAR